MKGAIAGDMFGAGYEGHPFKSEDIDLYDKPLRFTDDSVLTVATADALMTDGDYADAYHRWGNRYPYAGYGGMFIHWLASAEPRPYNSFGNGSAMRVSPVAWALDTLDQVLAEAARSAAVTHDHPEGIKGAQAVAAAVFLARTGADKATIRSEITGRFGFDLERTVAAIRPGYHFDVTCQGSVPEAIIAFLESDDFEHAVRLAISLGGDADTQACMAGAIAEPFHGLPARVDQAVRQHLEPPLLEIVDRFTAKFRVER